jgi:hypothetical protein
MLSGCFSFKDLNEKTKTSPFVSLSKPAQPEAVAALIDDIIQWNDRAGELPEALKKKHETENSSKTDPSPFSYLSLRLE